MFAKPTTFEVPESLVTLGDGVFLPAGHYAGYVERQLPDEPVPNAWVALSAEQMVKFGAAVDGKIKMFQLDLTDHLAHGRIRSL